MNIVIVGAGAGGLALATRLGNVLGKKMNITLINPTLTHLWKPLWHEVAAGTLDSHEDELNLVTHAYSHYFNFQLGSMENIDRQQKQLILSPLENILPRRTISYDILVIAVGSITNTFNTAGAMENCYFLDNLEQAEIFQKSFLKAFIAPREKPLTIAIVGGGATGIELAGELNYAAKQALKYGWARVKEKAVIKIFIIEAAQTILSNLPDTVIQSTMQELQQREIEVYTDERIIKVDEKGLYTQNGNFIQAELKVWAAGIKAPDFLKNLAGLETNRFNQLIVNDTLQTTNDENIFALGDCAAYAPPRAQAAQQQADLLFKSLIRKLKNKPLLKFVYHDYGTIITVSRYQTIANIITRFRNLFLSGPIARFAYNFLYRQHQAVLHGWWHVFLIALAKWLTKGLKPRLKLH